MFFGSRLFARGRVSVGQMLFSNSSSCPDGIVAANDVMAIGLWEAALNAGLEVPEDVSLVGIDNTLASIMRPQMASWKYLLTRWADWLGSSFWLE